jgi:hypothetical protein
VTTLIPGRRRPRGTFCDTTEAYGPFTNATYWLAVFFTALLTVGALIEWARKSPRKHKARQHTISSSTPAHPEPPLPRTTRSVLAGAVSGLVVSVLFFPHDRSGQSRIYDRVRPVARGDSHARIHAATSGADPTELTPHFPGQLVTVRATPGTSAQGLYARDRQSRL